MLMAVCVLLLRCWIIFCYKKKEKKDNLTIVSIKFAKEYVQHVQKERNTFTNSCMVFVSEKNSFIAPK